MQARARTNLPQYTYRHRKSDERVIYKRLAIIASVTIILILIVWFWGLAFLQIIGNLSSPNDAGGGNNRIELPLIKPNFSPPLPEFTKSENIDISGNTTPGASVSLRVNGIEVSSTVADTSGGFTFLNVAIEEGANIIKLIASNDKGETLEQKGLVSLDKTPPKLTLTSPKDGEKFPEDTKVVQIKGVAEEDAKVLINSIQTPIDQQGAFSFNFPVQSGENKIEVKAQDEAGNEKIIKLTIEVEN